MTDKDIISIKNFKLSFGNKEIIRGLSFNVKKGEIFGFLGSNGSGKTTTIRALLGIYQADSGELLINGEEFSPERVGAIGYLPEERGLYKKEKVIDVMQYFGRLKGLSKKEAQEFSKKYLKRVGLEDKANLNIDKKTLENTGNIKMQYHVQEGNDSSSQGKSDPKNVAAVEEVINKLSVSQNEVNSRGKINLPKTMNASNGVPVTIRWTTSNSSFLSITGKINKQFLGGGDKSVVLKAVAKAGNDSREKSFNINIPVETTREMLERAARNIYLPETGKNLPSSVRVNIGKGTVDVPIVWMSGGNRVQSAGDTKGLTAILNYQGTEYKRQY